MHHRMVKVSNYSFSPFSRFLTNQTFNHSRVYYCLSNGRTVLVILLSLLNQVVTRYIVTYKWNHYVNFGQSGRAGVRESVK